jgi:hypothetical protein
MDMSGTVARLIGPPEADGEYVELRGGDVVHLHDYPRFYAVPGLYEHVVQELLGCRSPQVAAEGFERALEALALDPAEMTALDLGAGTGLVGELVRGFGVTRVVGFDALAAARDACLRDRPGVYLDYLVGDLADPAPGLLQSLRAHEPGGLVSAGAFGGTHAPPVALLNALSLLPLGAPVVFTIDERWTGTDALGGFRSAIDALLGSGRLELIERSRFLHRLTTAGEPVHYELFVGVNRRSESLSG